MNCKLRTPNSELSKKDRADQAAFAFVMAGMICLYLILCLALELLLVPSLGWAEEEKPQRNPSPSLVASLDRDSARVGAIIGLTLRMRLPEGAMHLDPPAISGLEGLTLLNRQVHTDRIVIRFLADKLDTRKIGPFTLSFLDGDGNSKTLTSNPVSLTVTSNLGEKPEEARLRPIQDIIPIATPWLRYLPWTAGVVALAFVAFGLLWWFRRYRRIRLAGSAQDPPHVRARKALEQLEAEGFFERGEFKAFYFRFSAIMRHYLENLRGFPAAEYTTEEIASHIDHEQDRQLLTLLRQVDLVKFADAIPTLARKANEVKTAFTYIAETTPLNVSANRPETREDRVS